MDRSLRLRRTHSRSRRPTLTAGLRVALVEWSGGVGGAELLTNALAISLRAAGIDARVVVVGDPFPACRQLHARHVPHVSFGAKRGRQILRSPRSFAALVNDAGPDAAVLQSDGFLGAVLRLGGYKGRLVAVEHGALPSTHRVRSWADRRSGVWAIDAQVAVSDYLRDLVLARAHAPRVERIYGGIDLTRFRPTASAKNGLPFTVGFVGRLFPGKGVEHLLAAIAAMRDPSTQLVIAGEGSQRPELELLSRELGLAQRVRFVGLQDDVTTVWRVCDVCVVPSVAPEGAGMVALEAAGCGRPVIASMVGGLPELVQHDRTGTLVAPGDVEALARVLDAYAGDPDRRARHGLAGRRRCETTFDIRRCAAEYANLLLSI